MLFAIIIALIIGLVIIAIVANTMQQQREKQEADRRQQMTKYKTIIDETEEIIMNSANVPISKEGFDILYHRILSALQGMNETTPNQKDVKSRIQEVKDKISSADYSVIDATGVELPDNEKAMIGLLQGIKKYRTILRSEHGKGRVSSNLFMVEDKRVEKVQLRINVDSQMRRGKMAMNNNMTGSARQYFEKALATLDNQSYVDEYITARRAELESMLEQITQELKSANASSVKKKLEEEKDDLDQLFAPKKKW
jgi:Na+-transporting NADH:ubiquinone oxidoreductase subunit NqrC